MVWFDAKNVTNSYTVHFLNWNSVRHQEPLEQFHPIVELSGIYEVKQFVVAFQRIHLFTQTLDKSAEIGKQDQQQNRLRPEWTGS